MNYDGIFPLLDSGDETRHCPQRPDHYVSPEGASHGTDLEPAPASASPRAVLLAGHRLLLQNGRWQKPLLVLIKHIIIFYVMWYVRPSKNVNCHLIFNTDYHRIFFFFLIFEIVYDEFYSWFSTLKVLFLLTSGSFVHVRPFRWLCELLHTWTSRGLGIVQSKRFVC